ncbi:MAG: hypothetical protein M9894_23190 [Planctomycetes bacterium]|nr:hypothetical protein [Planctomycetota bacterium]
MGLELPDELRARPQGPRAADHALQLYARALHPELLELARSRRVEGAGWRARVGLLQHTGHLLEVVFPGEPGRRGAGRAIAEVLAPVALELPPSGRVDIRRVGASASGLIDEDCGVAYTCSWSFERVPEADYPRLHAHVLEGGPAARGERLLVNRGHPENDDPAPFSALELAVDPDEGRLETFVVHAFPADRAFLFVHSVVRV